MKVQGNPLQPGLTITGCNGIIIMAMAEHLKIHVPSDLLYWY